MRRLTYAALTLTLSVTLAACGTTGEEQADDPTGSSPTSSAPTDSSPTTEDSVDTTSPGDKPDLTISPGEPGQPGEGLPIGPVPDAVKEREDVQAAVAAEAKRAGVDASQVEIAGYADVTWTDGSIGCPQPDQMYTMALVPGHQLILSVDGQVASYHAAEGKEFAYCANPKPPAAGDGRVDM